MHLKYFIGLKFWLLTENKPTCTVTGTCHHRFRKIQITLSTFLIHLCRTTWQQKKDMILSLVLNNFQQNRLNDIVSSELSFYCCQTRCLLVEGQRAERRQLRTMKIVNFLGQINANPTSPYLRDYTYPLLYEIITCFNYKFSIF